MEIPKAGEYVDRIGSEKGDYLSPMDSDGKPYPILKRATGDYLVEEKIEDNDSYHLYIIKQDFTRENFINAICKKFTGESAQFYLTVLARYYADAVDRSSELHREKYCDCSADDANGIKAGTIDEMFLFEGDIFGKGADGGGVQYIMPFNVETLKELGMIEERKSRE